LNSFLQRLLAGEDKSLNLFHQLDVGAHHSCPVVPVAVKLPAHRAVEAVYFFDQ
jgi:hypothetical protein